jgi:hypothetical protein
MLVAIMVQRDRVEVLEWVRHIASRCGKTTIQWNTLERHGSGATDVDTLALLDISKVDRVDSTLALIGDDGRLHVSNQGPLRRAEEGMRLDVRCASASAQPSVLVLDEQLAHQRFAEARTCQLTVLFRLRGPGQGLLGYLRSSCVIREWDVFPEDVCKRRVPVLALERRRAVKHLVDQNAQRPPIHCARMATSLDDLRRNVLFGSYKRIRSEIRYA